MHKNEAAELFKVLSNPECTKICKMLYNKGDLSFNDLILIIGVDSGTLKLLLHPLVEKGLVVKNDDIYKINKEYIDELMSFISTPCGCARK